MSIIHPATIIIAGGTGSGKTVFTRALLENSSCVFQNLPLTPKVVWCYGIDQPGLNKQLRNAVVRYQEGMIDEESLRKLSPDIVVIDDMMSEKSDDKFTHNLFTKISHHCNVTVIFITQNLYEKGQCKMKRNAHYLVMMRNPSDKSQLTTLGRQLFPRKRSLLEHFYEAYDDATSRKYGYLFIDVSPNSYEKEKLKTNILPDPKSGQVRVIVYQPK